MSPTLLRGLSLLLLVWLFDQGTDLSVSQILEKAPVEQAVEQVEKLSQQIKEALALIPAPESGMGDDGEDPEGLQDDDEEDDIDNIEDDEE